MGGGGGGEGRFTGPSGGGFPPGSSLPTAPLPGIPDGNIPNPNSPITGERRDSLGPVGPVSPVGPHGPYGPGPVGPRAQPEQVPRASDSENIERNNNTIINNRIDRTPSSITNENIQGQLSLLRQKHQVKQILP
jgi:hypothetical protein